ncbi:RsmD family RNA methyltransferase [Micromonospora coriariae]|uniref:hypothetical protein n=1 Tax=Micromonospora coriariae TaxID=285665 RepID=UPI000B5AF31D|nr:hypothetical protein [Micromonospora coriariae]
MCERVDARQSDVFSAVDGDFDLIIFDPPFRWSAPRDLLRDVVKDGMRVDYYTYRVAQSA